MELAERLSGAVWGHLVGDAVGVPYEFRAASAIRDVRWAERGTHGQPPGTWSDDGALMLALLDSLLDNGFDPDDQGKRALAWYREGRYAPGGKVFDIGNATLTALHNLEAGAPAERAGPTDEYSSGNGSLMRILPLALVERDSPARELVELAHRASRLTHGHARPQVACALYVLVARGLLAGAGGRAQVLTDARGELRQIYESADFEPAYLAALDYLEGWTERQGRGRVWDSFWSAWDAFVGAGSYRETIERAICYGNDTDTTAAIAGGLAGIRWGIDGIPAEWLDGMRGKDIVAPLVARLLKGAGYLTDPVYVIWLPTASVPELREVSGAFGMTLLPGRQWRGQAGKHWHDLESDAVALRNVELVDTLLVLVEDFELERARARQLEAVMEQHGIELLRQRIVDGDIPADREAYRLLLGGLRERIDAGKRVAICCMGGLGRTGTTVACLLVEAGMDAESAIELTRKTRHGTIENERQERFVREWPGP